MIKRLFKIALIVGLVVVSYFGFWLSYGTAIDWKPEGEVVLKEHGSGVQAADSVYELVTWNLGFAGLGAESSFFFDGGETVILEKELVEKNLKGIQDFVKAQPSVDFWLFQEIDSTARRSHHIDQIEQISQIIPEFTHTLAINFNHDFIPVPLFNPYGEVRSGIATFSRFDSRNQVRHAYGTEYPWPRRIFYLDRCFLSQEISLDDGKMLTVINTHCSAYDSEGSMVAQQVKEITQFAESEYEKGNYVVIGGDWNQCPPGYQPIDSTGSYNEFILQASQLPKGWSWVADISTPTNRKNEFAYVRGETYTSVIDQFVVSPNLEVEEVRVHDLDFQFSDHQPVYLRIRLKP